MIEVYGIRYRDGGFILDPDRPEDAHEYLGRPEIKDGIDSVFNDATRFNEKPHTLIYGGSYSGKTHTIAYIKNLVKLKHSLTDDDLITVVAGAGIKNDFVKLHEIFSNSVRRQRPLVVNIWRFKVRLGDDMLRARYTSLLQNGTMYRRVCPRVESAVGWRYGAAGITTRPWTMR